MNFYYRSYIIYCDGHIVGTGSNVIVNDDILELRNKVIGELKIHYPDRIFVVTVSMLRTELTQQEAQTIRTGWTVE